jgi:hypothetical protein
MTRSSPPSIKAERLNALKKHRLRVKRKKEAILSFNTLTPRGRIRMIVDLEMQVAYLKNLHLHSESNDDSETESDEDMYDEKNKN